MKLKVRVHVLKIICIKTRVSFKVLKVERPISAFSATVTKLNHWYLGATAQANVRNALPKSIFSHLLVLKLALPTVNICHIETTSKTKLSSTSSPVSATAFSYSYALRISTSEPSREPLAALEGT